MFLWILPLLLFLAFALSANTHFYIVGIVHEGDPSDSHLKCAWVQTLDDYILESGVFSCPMVSPYKDVAELTFIIYVLNSLPLESAFLLKKPLIPRRHKLIPLVDEIFPSSLKTMGLFTGVDELLTHDPIVYWRSISDIKNFFSLLGLFDSQCYNDTFQQSIYLRLLVSNASTFFQFRLKLWFDELPVMYRLCQRFPGLYANDSCVPTVEFLWKRWSIYSFVHLALWMLRPLTPSLYSTRILTVELIQRFIIKLATKISYSPACKRSYEELLTALRNLDSIGLPSLLSESVTQFFLRPGFSEALYHVIFRPSLCDIPD
ncbi:unnamed protein product [Rhizophagus irregularis]|nr:unnamed protein product [Rhizophagus irregularis]